MKPSLLWGARPVLLALLVVVGCSSPSATSRGPLVELGIDDGASAGQKKSAKATAKQGVTVTLDNGAKLAVPAGAVDKDTDIAIQRPPDAEALEYVKRLDQQSAKDSDK